MTDKMIPVPDVDRLANIIREADGKNDLGAGALAEKIVKALLREAAQPETALSKYREFTSEGEDEDPVERLRFFCAQAMSGQDWLDVERFFNALKPSPADEELRRDAELLDWLEERVKESGLHGVSLDYVRFVEDGHVVEKGFRVMRRHYLGDRHSTLRAALEAEKREG